MRVAKQDAQAKSSSKTRVQIDLASAQLARLNRLMVICDIETRKDLFNVALSLLEWAVGEVREGRSIAAIDKQAKHIVELAMPALSDAARRRNEVIDAPDATDDAPEKQEARRHLREVEHT